MLEFGCILLTYGELLTFGGCKGLWLGTIQWLEVEGSWKLSISLISPAKPWLSDKARSRSLSEDDRGINLHQIKLSLKHFPSACQQATSWMTLRGMSKSSCQ